MALKIESVEDRYREGSQWLKLLVAGPPGVGKTLLAASFPNVLYADAEGRLLSVRKRPVKAVKVTSTAVLDELRAAMAQSPDVREKVLGAPVDTIVLDTVDEIARLIIRERLRAEKRETMSMPDWGYLGDTLRALLRGFRNLPCNVIFNVHLKSQEDSETGRVAHKPSIQGSVGDEIAAYVDESFLMVARPMNDPKTGERIIARHLQTFPDPQHDWVKDHSGTLPQEFPVDFATDYQRLAALIFGDEPAKPARPARGARGRAAAPGPPSGEPSITRDAATADPDPSPQESELPTTAPAPADDTSAADSGSDDQQSAGAAANGDDMTTSVPDAGDDGAGDVVPCTDCGKPLDPVDDEKQITQSNWRWKVTLCRDCYLGRKNAKSTAKPAKEDSHVG